LLTEQSNVVNIIVVHNRYQLPGGEDRVFEAEMELLRSRGHRVEEFQDQNDRVATLGKVELAVLTVWNQEAHDKLATLVRTTRAEVVHFHNTFPLFSPACYYAARREGAAVVQTLHNYRLLCPNAVFNRSGRVCEDCFGRVLPWPGVLHRCYRGSLQSSAVTAGMIAFHRLLGTWRKAVDAYIALTDFSAAKFVQGGLPAAKVHVKPNFLRDDPGFHLRDGDHALFIGRLVEEKGLRTLLGAWETLDGTVPLKIVGQGPMAGWIRKQIAKLPSVDWHEHVSREGLWKLMKSASFLVVPSTWYEGLPAVILEAFAVGCPVIVSDIGSLSTAVSHGRTGLRFDTGDVAGLSAAVRLLAGDTHTRQAMARSARAEFEERYSPEASYHHLLRIYSAARETAAAARDGIRPAACKASVANDS
jgi:glycosyltransferase involved in cell wall biosynthesis